MVYIDDTTKKLLIGATVISVLIVVASVFVSLSLSAAPRQPQLELKPFGTNKVALYLNPTPVDPEEVLSIQVRLSFDPSKVSPQNILSGNFWPKAQIVDNTIDIAGTINLTLAKGMSGETVPTDAIGYITLPEGTDPREAYLLFDLNTADSYLTALGHTRYFPITQAE
jgi:hypothetical protein